MNSPHRRSCSGSGKNPCKPLAGSKPAAPGSSGPMPRIAVFTDTLDQVNGVSNTYRVSGGLLPGAEDRPGLLHLRFPDLSGEAGFGPDLSLSAPAPRSLLHRVGLRSLDAPANPAGRLLPWRIRPDPRRDPGVHGTQRSGRRQQAGSSPGGRVPHGPARVRLDPETESDGKDGTTNRSLGAVDDGGVLEICPMVLPELRKSPGSFPQHRPDSEPEDRRPVGSFLQGRRHPEVQSGASTGVPSDHRACTRAACRWRRICRCCRGSFGGAAMPACW